MFGNQKGDGMKAIPAVVLGVLILIAAIAHALVAKNHPAPIQRGRVVGEVLKQEANGIAHLKCDGFKAECYESLVVIHVDKVKEPSWTDNYVLTIPWSKIEHLTLMP